MADSYNTRSAARLLGVSEASVRRWSDAGLLPVQRVGRRGTRRFAEADLRAFAEVQARRDPESHPTGARVAAHEHFASFYAADSARMRLTVPFLRDGLLAGERCYLVASQQLVDEYMEVLPEGDLVIRSGVGSTARNAVDSWEEAWVQALSSGVRSVRVVGEMASYDGFTDRREMLDYEVAYDNLSKRFPVSTICQYDVRAFDGGTVLGALEAHPDLFTRRISDFLL